MRYMLDANALIAFFKAPEGAVGRRLTGHSPAEIGLSAVVVHELYFGAYRSRRRDANLARVDRLYFEVLSLEQEDARHAGEIRAALASQGVPIGAYDVLIAGQARARGLTLVTRNLREFQRVPGLAVENWEA
jgi:tRNA(fMet)-specific endonuclease VapC